MATVVHRSLAEIVSPPHAALLVVDVQNDLCPPSYASMLPRLKRLIEAARKAQVFLVYVQNIVLPGGVSHSPSEISRRTALGLRLEYTLEGSPGAEFVADISPRPGDPVVRKHRLNAFEGTSLDLLLRSRGIQTIVCTGSSPPLTPPWRLIITSCRSAIAWRRGSSTCTMPRST